MKKRVSIMVLKLISAFLVVMNATCIIKNFKIEEPMSTSRGMWSTMEV